MMEVASNYMFRPLWWPSSDLDIKVIKVFLHIALIHSYASMYNLMMATTKAETCSC